MYINREDLKNLRGKYQEGSRVELIRMDDAMAPSKGTKGTVEYVDDAGTIHVRWDNGSGLGVAYIEDSCKLIEKE